MNVHGRSMYVSVECIYIEEPRGDVRTVATEPVAEETNLVRIQ